MLAASILPFVLLTVLAGHTVRAHLQQTNRLTLETTEQMYLNLYETNLNEQAEAIDSEMRRVEDAVLVAKKTAEALFVSEPRIRQLVDFEYDEFKGGFGERGSDGKGTVFIISRPDEAPSDAQRRDLALMKSLFPLFQASISRNVNIVSMYYIHPENGSFFVNPQDVPVMRYPISPDVRDLTTYPFYLDALRVPPGTDRVAWTSPYLDITPKGWMFTATAPVYDGNDGIRGVVAADVTIERFVGNVLDKAFGNADGFAFLLDREYGVIAAQRHGQEQLRQLNAAEWLGTGAPNGFRRLTLNGETNAVFDRLVPTTNWVLGYIVPERKMLEPVSAAARSIAGETSKRLFVHLSVLCLLTAALCAAIAFYLRSRVSRPVTLLMKAFSGVQEGQFGHRLDDTRTYEFNRLLHSFNAMNVTIRRLIEEQKALNRRLEQNVEQRTRQLKETNEELERRVDELLRLEHWRKSLFMNISHDLKTPITLIQGYIEAIRDGTIPPDKTPAYLDRIHEGIRTITNFVRSLTDLSRLENRDVPVDLVPIEAREFASAVAARWGDYLAVANRRFTANLDSGTAVFRGDAHLLNRAIDNLIENAAKYSGESSLIAFEYERTEPALLFRIRDEGFGIPEAEMPYVFQSFYRVDRSRNSQVPGSGLGLSIAKEIAAIHDGELTVRANESGIGCTFTLVIPRNAGQEKDPSGS